MFKKINYGLQHIDKKDELEVIKSLRNKQITQGEYVEKIEKKFNETVRSKFALACSSGTAALHLALMSLGLKKNDNVIIPSINFVAAASICKLMGANIYFCDVEKDTFQASKKNILDCIKKYKLKSIKVIFAMHLGGAAINSEEIYKIKKKIKCVIIEDACHALGGHYPKNKKNLVGSCKYSDFSIFSFHPVKSITSGEGGLVTTNSEKYFKKLKVYRSHGIERKENYTYQINENFLNYRLSDLNCSLAYSQIKKLNKFINRRRELTRYYIKKLSSHKEYIKVINERYISSSACHLLIVEINFDKLNLNYKNFFNKLKSRGIYCQLHYIPTYKFKAFSYLKTKPLENSEYYNSNCLSLPLFFSLTKNQINYICDNLKNIIYKNLYEQ